ncbi:hypothetical protein AT864_03071 [Anoxybacillus sp. P3H1B]|nr:hypothetical protein AT864_03071 [Anoxybacillus sp. P3H1B]
MMTIGNKTYELQGLNIYMAERFWVTKKAVSLFPKAR